MCLTNVDDFHGWLEELKRGSEEAFGQCYEKYAPFVTKTAYRLTQDHMEAEDVCQDVFIEVYRRIHQYEPERGSFEAWLSVITRCRALDRIRKRQRVQCFVWDSPEIIAVKDPSPSTEDSVLTKWECERIQEAMKHIPQEQRMALWETYYMDFTQREVAERMNRPLGSVKSMIRYGVGKMRKQLEPFVQANV